jgi:hypothetical protein
LFSALFTFTAPTFGTPTEKNPNRPVLPTILPPVYATLASRIDTTANPAGGLTAYPTVAVNFSVPSSKNATVFYSVGTFIKAGQCCVGAYLSLLSVDNGSPGAQVGCGGSTAQYTNVLVTVSCFGRLSFSAGQHTITLFVENGGGTWTIEAGPTTSILVQFDA